MGRRADVDVLDASLPPSGTAWGLREAERGWQNAESAGITLREADQHLTGGAAASALELPSAGGDARPHSEDSRWWLVVVRHEGHEMRLRTDRGQDLAMVVVGPLAAAEWRSPPAQVTCWRGDQCWATARVDDERSQDVRYTDAAGQALARALRGMLFAEAVQLARANGFHVRDLSGGGAFTQDLRLDRIDLVIGSDGRVGQALHG